MRHQGESPEYRSRNAHLCRQRARSHQSEGAWLIGLIGLARRLSSSGPDPVWPTLTSELLAVERRFSSSRVSTNSGRGPMLCTALIMDGGSPIVVLRISQA